MGKRRTVKKRKNNIRHKVRSRKLVSSSLRKSNSPKGTGFPKIYVINLKRDKTKWKKYKEDYKKGKIDRYSACLGIDPQTKYRSDFQRNEKKTTNYEECSREKEEVYSRNSNITFRSDKKDSSFEK